MAIGLGILGHSPDCFWQMTPKELAAAIGGLNGVSGQKSLRRDELSTLMNRFPDEVNHG